MLIRNLRKTDIPALRSLASSAAEEGFKFLDRFVREIEAGGLLLNSPVEFFLCIEDGSEIVAIGGLTPDPYTADPLIGRIRHVYVRPGYRGRGIGKHLVREIEELGTNHYREFSLRTDTLSAAKFYEALGYQPVEGESTTHRLRTRPENESDRYFG
jgi:N-acetylglutamate synthase-like GNAT family acetyltransferase